MDDSAIVDQWTKELDLDNWWKDLLGDQSSEHPDTFDFEKVKEKLPRTEILTSEIMKGKIAHYLSYVEATGTWYAWDGRIHAPCDGDALAYKLAKLAFSAMRKALSEVEAVVNYRKSVVENTQGDEKDIKKITAIYTEGFKQHRAWRDRLASDQGLSALVRLMRSDFDVPRDHFEHDQDFLVVKNCVFDLTKMRENADVAPMAHGSHRPVTKYLDIVYDPNVPVESSRWWEYLQSSIKDADIDTLNHLQKVVGAAFMGMSKLRIMINLKGPPSSGKSIFVETFWKMGKEGAGYCAMPDSRSITKVQGQNFEQDHFRGRRFIAIPEPSSSESIDDDFLKRFTGDVWVETRTLNAKSSGWAPQGVIFVSSNATLKINSRDQAIVDRTQIIDFPYEFVEEPNINNPLHKQRDNSLGDTLEMPHERSAILNWILIGMIKYNSPDEVTKKKRSLLAPLSVEKNKADLVSNASSALRWLYDSMDSDDIVPQITSDTHTYVNVTDSYTRYSLWCSMNGERRTLPRRYFEEDIGHRYPIVKFGGNKYFQGLMHSAQFHNKISNRGELPTPSANLATLPTGTGMDKKTF